ncbi:MULTISPECIES: helix-turn-helix domain-containing protein [Streptomyces]|uniref:helix-turn-helix domain-containing protein n=1 Tax=Streptomyces TaxID=1883 RepID=UPI001164D7F3|nr:MULTISPECIES: MerR family transcriptional regulator [unclassified Streptomyces]QDN80572.1 MerR family transcriptional regulator [Streptomyces sp. S1A1-7]QDO00894.1 MerR family transcriptional regulator [Streptomyces sp. RLB1-9]QDO22624.1 MerR family transcriptional regulator [Streptomyces sp. S1A1-8]QDO32751.1 MerR family transcriptional regulator [Streptomyces sp. S1A1-3]QDO42683.1 MerR family transcriptional regulator [Streptomyces sp. RLB3-17]
MIDDGTGLLTIGELARATGLTVRTIRYWSDEGALPPVARSSGGYRLYDAGSVARLELIRTLRELGLGLDAVRKVLAGETTVAEVAAAHVTALDAQISSLKVTRAVLSSVARRGSTAEEMTLMNKLARLSAAERKRIMEEFVEELFHGLDSVDPAIQERMRSTAVDLPQDPTPEQVDAWVELAEMVQDPEFRAQMREVVEFNAADRDHAAAAGRSVWFPMRLLRLGTEARARGIAPESPEAAALLREVLGDGDPAAVLERMESASNDRLARYRELLSTVKGAGTPSAHRAEFGWVVAALRAGADR